MQVHPEDRSIFAHDGVVAVFQFIDLTHPTCDSTLAHSFLMSIFTTLTYILFLSHNPSSCGRSHNIITPQYFFVLPYL